MKGKLSYGRAFFFFLLNAIRCFATSKACAFNACSVGSTLLNAPCVVNWGGLGGERKTKKNETQSKRVQGSFIMCFLDFRMEAEVTLKWNVL